MLKVIFMKILILFIALLKMGDFYWYGCGGSRDAHLAAKNYVEAAKKNDPRVRLNGVEFLY
jgi:TPR repeat protein